MSYIDKGRYKTLLTAARWFSYTYGFVYDKTTNLWLARTKDTRELEVFGSKLKQFRLGITPNEQLKLINNQVRWCWKKFNVPYYEPNDYEISVMFNYIKEELNDLNVEERKQKYLQYKNEKLKKVPEMSSVDSNLRDDIF